MRKIGRDSNYTSIVTILVMIIMSFGAIGLYLIRASNAANVAASLEPENGQQAGTTIINDTLASGGKALKYGSATPPPPPPPPVTTDVSWSSHVTCTATITTIAKILGTEQSSLGGATFAGGGYTPGSPNKNSLAPPCTVNGHTIFVELKKVKFTDGSVVGDGDFAGNLTDPNAPATSSVHFKNMHSEVNRNWAAGSFKAPDGTVKQGTGWVPTNPPLNTLIDIQGFVFWDTYHVTEAFHHYSGWEIHTITAWRIAQ